MRTKGGFTLIEMFVVVSIVCIMAAILIPAVVQAKKKADDIKKSGACCECWDKNEGCKANHVCRWCSHPCHWGTARE